MKKGKCRKINIKIGERRNQQISGKVISLISVDFKHLQFMIVFLTIVLVWICKQYTLKNAMRLTRRINCLLSSAEKD
jgi:hypothetical protein